MFWDKKRMYNYFVSYSHSKDLGNNSKEFGFGMSNIFINYKIRDYKDVLDVKKAIEDMGASNVIIVNYQLLKG